MCIFKKKKNNFITLCVLNIPLFIAFFEDAKFVGVCNVLHRTAMQ